jgi:DNA-directed RNA polymerase specialized sigma54-like protein
MLRDQFGFLVYSLEELHQHLKDELAKNPFLRVPDEGAEESEGDSPPPRKDDPAEPG